MYRSAIAGLQVFGRTKIPGEDAIFGDFVEFTHFLVDFCHNRRLHASSKNFWVFFLTIFFIFSSHLCTLLTNLQFFCQIYGLFLLNLHIFLSIVSANPKNPDQKILRFFFYQF